MNLNLTTAYLLAGACYVTANTIGLIASGILDDTLV